jgi:hypothetical protein
MRVLIEPKELIVNLPNGGTKTFVLSKFPAIAGREIITQYPVSAIPKLGDYAVNETLMLKLMEYVGVRQDNGNPDLCLDSRALVDNHTGDFETLMKIEMAMMEYNCSFFAQGKVSKIFEGLATKARQLITQTLKDYSAKSSEKS